MRQFNPDTDCIVVVDNHHGRFIPREFCERYRNELEAAGFSQEVESVISNANADYDKADWEEHDESWNVIEGNYLHKEHNREWIIAFGPCGDLLLVANDVEMPDDLM